MNKSVSLIILNWNGLGDTIECVESCFRLDYPVFRIVLVDNGSSDGSETTLREMFPGVTFIQTGANLGYAGGNNAGIRNALVEGADYIWLLNNDTVVAPDALNALVTQAEADLSIGMVGSKILTYSRPTLLLYAGGRIDISTGETKHIGYGCEVDGPFDRAGDTGYITGCSMLVTRRLIEDIGLMNETYFLYFEETEWCVKAQRAGYRLVYAPGSVVYHKESAAARRMGGAMIYYMVRNRLRFIARNAARAHWLRRFVGDIRLLLSCIRKKDARSTRGILKAYRHWIAGYCGPEHAPERRRDRT